MLQAYENRKYGFVPDYARLDIIHQHGGIYLDTDVELIRSLDELLPYECYCGFEDKHYIALGLGFGAAKGNPLIQKMMETYENLDFVKDGVLNLTASPVYQTKIMQDEGFLLNGEYQEKTGLPYYRRTLLRREAVCYCRMKLQNILFPCTIMTRHG